MERPTRLAREMLWPWMGRETRNPPRGCAGISLERSFDRGGGGEVMGGGKGCPNVVSLQ